MLQKNKICFILIIISLYYFTANIYSKRALGQIQKESPPIVCRVYNDGSIEKLEISSGEFKGKVSPGTKGRVYFINSNTERIIADIEVTEIKGDGIVCAKKIKGSKTIKIKAGDYVLFSLEQSSGEKDADAYFESGNVHFKKGEYDRAIADYNRALDINSRHTDAYYHRGYIYHLKGEYDKALSDYNHAIEINAKYSQVYHNRGNIYLTKGKYDLVIEDCNKALEINPMAETFYTRGVAYGNKGRYELAIADYSKAIEMNSEYVDAYNNRGLTYVWMRKYDLATADCNKALEINPRYPQAYNNRGLAYTGKGEYDRAIKDYNKALEIDPMHYQAYGNRGGAYMGKGEYDLAIEEFKKALDIKPDYVEAYYNMANACDKAGYKKKAIELYKSFIRYVSPEGSSDIIQETKQKIKELESSVGSSDGQAELPDVSSPISQNVRMVIELLDSNDPQKQKKGIFLMKKEKIKSIKAIPSLIKILNNNNDSLACVYSHPSSSVMLDFNSMGRKAAEILIGIDEPAVESLIPVLKSDSMLTRMNAVFALRGIGDARAVIPLITALNQQNKPKDADDGLYWEWLVIALGELRDKRAVEILIQILSDHNEHGSIRRHAAWALGEIKDSRAVETLIDVLDETFCDIPWNAKFALKKITGEDIDGGLKQWQEWWNQNREKFNKSE